MNPAAFWFGMTTTQEAFDSSSCGMPLSEAFIISFKSSVAAVKRASASFCASTGNAHAAINSAPVIIFIIFIGSSCPRLFPRFHPTMRRKKEGRVNSWTPLSSIKFG
jgi:hypothetical protein